MRSLSPRFPSTALVRPEACHNSRHGTRSTMARPWGPGHVPPWRPWQNTAPDTDTGSLRPDCPTGLLPGPCTGRVGPPPHLSIRWSSIISRRSSPKPYRPTPWVMVFPPGLSAISAHIYDAASSPTALLGWGHPPEVGREDCGYERLVPFSCKGRGVCPSRNSRRMAEVAAHITDHVLPHLPVRQWVLSLPDHASRGARLRPFLHNNPRIAGAVLQILLRVLSTYRVPGKAEAAGRPGSLRRRWPYSTL